MNSKQLKQIESNISQGSVSSRLGAAEEAIPDLRQDLKRLSETARAKCTEYTATFEAWTSRAVNGVMRPLAIERDVRDARLVNGVAWGLTVTELALSVFLALLFLVNPVFVVLLALVGIFSMKAGLLAIWRDDAQPQRTRGRLLRWVLAPSLAVTLLSLTVLLFTRGVMGWLALLLLPFLNLALFALSLGVMGLAAGLFSLGYLLSWSRHAEQKYNALEREAVETRRVLQIAQQVVEQLRNRGNGGSGAGQDQWPATLDVSQESSAQIVPLRSPQSERTLPKRRNGSNGFLAVGLLMGALGVSGCDFSKVSQPAASTNSQAVANPASETMLMELWLDWSLSAETQSYEEALRSFLAALPALVKRHNVERVTALRFGDRAWSAQRILDAPLPMSPSAIDRSESSAVYGQISAEQLKQAEARRQIEMESALAGITLEKLLPANAAEPPCTDVQGVLERIAASARTQRRLIFVVTDGQENCSRRLRAVEMAQANAGIVFVLLPETPKAVGATRPDEQWRLRRGELLQIAPSALVIPHFGDWIAATEQAAKR
ncbi:MAG: hypothetical protein SF097_18295 [Acidobacteriota bacterium]|nr:hypothetical protein [Acidobacteriota bacterium]